MKKMKNTENKKFLKLRFDIRSLVVFTILFLVEVFIALFVDDSIIRPYGGDVLVVILIYYFGKIFFEIKPLYLIIAVLLFAYAIEIGQYFNMVDILGVRHIKILRIIIGSSFSWGDMLAYTIGAAICYFFDHKKERT